MELDAQTAPDGTVLTADVCVVGAGPAGLTLANELHARGRQVLLLESGGHGREPGTQELNAGETTGDPYLDLRLARSRGIGGTAAIWNTWFGGCPFAKYIPLDAIDFERREWMAWSGWPFGRSTLDPYYKRAQVVCGLGPFDYGPAGWNEPHHPLLPFGEGGLTNTIYQYGPADRFTVTLPASLAASPSATLVRNATLTELARNAGGERVTEARWTTVSGTKGVIRADRFVLAAGGIENARLLLLLLGSGPWLGWGFMEHPVDSSLRLFSRHPALPAPGQFYAPRSSASATPVLGRIGISPELLRSERLPNASIRLLHDSEPAVLQSAALRSSARRVVPLQTLRRLTGGAIRTLARATQPFRTARYQILTDLEQVPDPENRVMLSSHRDSLGRPQAVLQWRMRKADLAHRERIRSLVVRELEKAGAGRVRMDAEGALDPKHHHHAGTTRMHPDPGEGVVDEHLRVHRMDNLFVTGSSVFPTAGVANPTLTAIALTLRLADHLSGLG